MVCKLAGNGSEMIILPDLYYDRDDVGDDAEWRISDRSGDRYRCWQTTLIYQHIEDHPHLVKFIRPDPWTWLPVVANPGGPPLRTFLDTNRNEMYEERTTIDRSTACSRVKPRRLHLIYQWSLQLASALEHIHSYSFEPPAPKISIVFGDLSMNSCWLTPEFSLQLLGFLEAGFRTRSSALNLGSILSGEPYQPLYYARGQANTPTLQTDLFLWGCVVYELMTGFWPGNGQGLDDQEIATLIPRREWPRLETMYLGDVVRKCWTSEITSAAELSETVRRSVVELGAPVGDNDEVLDLDIAELSVCVEQLSRQEIQWNPVH